MSKIVTVDLTERELAVLELLTEDRQISVSAIAERLAVSPVSARNYLKGLSDKGHVVRIHGGAIAAFHAQILARQHARQEEKRRIAQAAAELVRDGDTVMIEAGTTTALVAKYLIGKRDVKVVTNNTLALTYARAYPGVQLTIVGGEFRASTESLVGPAAREQLERFHVGIAFVGTDGFSGAGGLTTNLVEGAEIVRLMASHAERAVVVADSSKSGRTGFVHTLAFDAVDELITDDGLPRRARREIAERGVALRIV